LVTDCFRIVGGPGEPGLFGVPSASQPGLVWYVDWQNAAVRYCGCPGFTRKNDCRHVREAEALWRREHDEVLTQKRADPARREAVAASIERMKELFS
jgi:hypothetical protein